MNYSTRNSPSVWLPYGAPRQTIPLRLFCFHHAGGSASVFRDWQHFFPPEIHVCAVELPGHGTRVQERLIWTMPELMDRLLDVLAPWLGMPFALFGHSMGAAVSFELAHQLRSRLGVQPHYLCLSGRRGPGRALEPPIHQLPQSLFIEKIRRLNGTPDEVLSNPEALDLLIPILRADFALMETYSYVERPPLCCPVLVLGGLDDGKVSRDDLLAWRDISSGSVFTQMLPGDHFYLNTSRVPLLEILSNHLRSSDPSMPDVRRSTEETAVESAKGDAAEQCIPAQSIQESCGQEERPMRAPSAHIARVAIRESDLVDAFEARAVDAPTAIALVAGSTVLTYAQLNQRANQLARYLRQLGVRPESRVALCLERNSDLLVFILAVMKAGGAYVPLDPSWPKDRMLWILKESRCSVVLGCARALTDVDDVAGRRVDLEQACQEMSSYPQHNLPRLAANDNAAYIIYTSGSTGRPKGVVVTRHNVMRLFHATSELFDFSAADVWSLCHSYAFDYSVWEMWGAWLHGARAVLASRVETQSPEQLYELLEREGVTILSQTPSAFRALLHELSRVPGRTLHARTIIFGGEALDPTMLSPFYERYPDKVLVNMYGITETTVHSTFKRLSAEDVRRAGRSPIGQQLPDLRVYLLNGKLEEVSCTETGEVFIAGDGVARCYLDNPALTAERFVPELNGPNAGERMYRTGDLARRLPNGELEYVGRCDQQVKIRGYRVELGEIESSLRRIPGVRDAAALLEGEGDECRLVAYVFREPERDVAADLLRQQMAQYLPEYMVPAVFVVLDSIPLTVNGKLDKRALPRPGMERPEQTQAYLPPRNHLEQTIAAIWADVLRVEAVGVQDNFFDLGGHSLLLVRVHERLREELRLNVSVIELFARPNISLLAQYIVAECSPDAAPSAKQSRQGDRRGASRRRREARASV